MALEGLEKAVSSGSVETLPEILEGYGPGNGQKASLPAAVAFPGSADDVIALVEWARGQKAKLVPASSAAPHSTALAGGDGYVMVDLSKMKKVVRADRRNRVALIEPGVTFDELDEALARVDLRAMAPLAVRKSKSVVAAYLDRTPTLVPRAQWDLADPLLCTEVVMGTGTLFRTGCASGPGTLEEQWASGQAQKNPMGPSAFDFFRLVQGSKGSMGILTWASVKCELRPRLHEMLMVAADDLKPVADVVQRISRAGWGEEVLVLDSVSLEKLTGVGGMPAFALLIGVAGFEYRPEQRVEYQESGIRKIIQEVGAKRATSLAGVGARKMLELITSPSDPCWKGEPADHCDVYWMTTMDRSQFFADMVGDICSEAGIDRSATGIYVQPQLGGRVAHFQVTVYAPAGAASKAARAIAEAALERGAYFSRPAEPFADLPYRGKPLLVDVFRRTKRLFDPDLVLNPDALFMKEVV